ncbi:S1/P1 nuclease [Pricia sp. S334]|uniref:S1/P1 nuclease n=1 Tax=Pricia mediterranea TaxID=3076079 RepID=A0ABU3L437_9FLAO|nr:S1/P1 nuclease [Pricia sp. S334]MDT7827862.1 S1/P1 nuclease [Pricia sp. S334]
MRQIMLLLVLATQFCFADAVVWSETGHRVVGEIAQEHLSNRAAKAIDRLLDGASLAKVSTFGDEIKADGRYRNFSPWHYVNYPADKEYGDEPPSKQGDLIIGIEKCIAVIKDRKSLKTEKAFYLKMLVHLMGDLHQPMHVGRLEDKGGNDIQVRWFNRGSNLHRVWDSNMIDDYGMSYTELSDNLPRLSKAQKEAVQKGDIYDWVEESQELANEVYDSVEMGDKLSYRYSYDWWPTVEIQLEKGGLRLAKVLNELF